MLDVPYVLSLSLLVLGLVVLVLVLAATWRRSRRALRVYRHALGALADRGGMLRARWAALRVAIAHRRG